MPLRIALLDDHVLFRQGLKSLLGAERDITIVGEASEARSLYEQVDAESPDLVVADIVLPGTSGIAATHEIRRRSPATKVFVLSMYADEEYVLQALGAGAAGYGLKSQDIHEVIAGIRSAATGRLYLAPTIPRSVLEEFRKRQINGSGSKGPLDALSPREREIFDMIVQNTSNREIAKHLCISVKTVETHRVSINRKLDVHSTAELIRFAAINGLVHR